MRRYLRWAGHMLWWLARTVTYFTVQTLAAGAGDLGRWPERPRLPPRRPTHDTPRPVAEPENAQTASEHATKALARNRAKRFPRKNP